MDEKEKNVLQKLFASRRFWLAVLGVVNLTLDASFKFPPGVRDGVNTLLLALIAAFTIEDGLTNFGTGG